MAHRIPPHLWPVVAAASPALAPFLALRYRTYLANRQRAGEVNRQRLDRARPLDLPALEGLSLTVLVEQRAVLGFATDPGVSYLLRGDRGALLFDVGFGPQTDSLAANARALGVSLDDVVAAFITHLHLDHMGGRAAAKAKEVALPASLGSPSGKPCYLPDDARAPGFAAEVVACPKVLPGGFGTTGPLARSLFFLGFTEEQALLAVLEGKGLVVVTGCGHPRIDVILAMARRLSTEPLYALVGGLHFPLTASRLELKGVQLQMVMGTGKPPWARITEEDLGRAIGAINEARPKKVLLSAHDTCDHALERFADELQAETRVLEAGATYAL